MTQPTRGQRPSGPLSEEEIKQALEAAGYPLEMRLYEELRTGGMDPVFGFRARVTDGAPTKEIDILASVHARVTRAEERWALAELRAVIQAKKIHDGCFVGFVAKDQPTPHELRTLRAPCAGLPFYRTIAVEGYEHHADYMFGEQYLGPAFDPLNAAPVCIQWTVARRTDKQGAGGAPRADQEAGTYDDIATMVRASAILARDYTMHRLSLSRDVAPMPDLHFYYPTLIVEAPLYTYAAHDQTLTPVDWLTLRLTIDTHAGVATVLVDVVSAKSIDALIERYKKAGDEMRARLELLHGTLAVIGVAQWSKWDEDESLRRALEAGPPLS